jgi:hypothetical protein
MATPRTGRPRGRPPKAKNKSTIEREKKIRLEIQAQMEREKAELAGKISAQGVTTIDDARALAAAQGPKLLKDIGAEFTRIFAGMAEYHRPRGRAISTATPPSSWSMRAWRCRAPRSVGADMVSPAERGKENRRDPKVILVSPEYLCQ